MEKITAEDLKLAKKLYYKSYRIQNKEKFKKYQEKFWRKKAEKLKEEQ